MTLKEGAVAKAIFLAKTFMLQLLFNAGIAIWNKARAKEGALLLIWKII